MKNGIYIWIILFSMSFIACQSNQLEDTESDGLMGKFDSVVVAQEKGPSVQYFYENMVQHISFPSKDSLPINADLYEGEEQGIRILLCHQAGYSRGAYIETGIILSKLGFNAMAIDQRSGSLANKIENLTAMDATAKGLPTEYLDAKQDIEAAIDYLYDCNGNQPIIIVGSSYSASLALLIGTKNQKIKAVAAFSPGEYLEGITLKDSLDSIQKPVFVTSAKFEIPQVEQIIQKIDSSYITHFKPETEGIHGAKALWKETEGHKSYWQAFLKFIKENY